MKKKKLRPRAKNGATIARLRSIDPEQSQEIGIEIERLIKGEMAYIVNWYVRNYQFAVRETFGWTPEDIMQEIRVTFWKGLATFDRESKIKITTYLSTMLHNMFANITKSCQSKKNFGTKLSREDSLSPSQEAQDTDTPDSLLDMSDASNRIVSSMTRLEQRAIKYQYFHDYQTKSPARSLRLGSAQRYKALVISGTARIKTEFDQDDNDEE